MKNRVASSRIVSVEEAMLTHEWVRKTPLEVRQLDTEPWLTTAPYLLVMHPCFGSRTETFCRIFDSYGGTLCAWRVDLTDFSALARRAGVEVERQMIESATTAAFDSQHKRARSRL